MLTYTRMNAKIVGVLLACMVVLVVGIAGCTGSDQSGATEKQTYVVGVDGNYAPYSYIETNGSITGFDVESVKWIAEHEGFDVKIQAMDWDAMIPALNANKIDMVYSGMTITPERAEQVTFSIPYLQINQSIAVNDDSGITMDDIMAGNVVMGAQRGTTGQIWVEENLIANGTMPKDNLKLYDNFPLVITDLQNQRIQASIYDRPSHLAAIAGKPIHIIGEINTGEEYGVAMRKDDTELQEKINTGLNDLMNDPYWQVLLENYGLA